MEKQIFSMKRYPENWSIHTSKRINIGKRQVLALDRNKTYGIDSNAQRVQQ